MAETPGEIEEMTEEEAEEALELAKTHIEAGELNEAEEILAQLEENPLCEEDEGIRKKIADLRAQQEKGIESASEKLDRIEELIQENEYGEAKNLLAQLKDSPSYEEHDEIQERAEALSKKLSGAETSPAERYFEDGMQAYENDDWTAAKELLEKAQDRGEYLGWFTKRRMNRVLDKIRGPVERCQKLYEEAIELFEEGDFDEAKAVFKQIRDSGIKYGKKIGNGMEERLNQMNDSNQEEDYEGEQNEERSDDISKAQEFEQSIADMARKRREIMGQIQAQKELRDRTLENLKEAHGYWEAEEYEEAKDQLIDIQEQLEELTIKGDEIEEARRDVETRLDEVDERIQEKKERERNLAELAEEFEEAQHSLDNERLLDAEDQLAEARAFAEEHELNLSDEQQKLAEEIEKAVWEEYGEERQARTDRYWELVDKADKYGEVAEWDNTLVLLQAAREADHLLLNENQQKALDNKLSRAQQKLKKREGTLEKVRSFAKQASEMLDNDEGQKALKKYRDALNIARGARIPVVQFLPVLRDHYAAAEKVWPEIVEEKVSELEEGLDEKIRDAADLRDYWTARSCMEWGNYDIAKPLLEELAADEDLDESKQKWAEMQLEGIDERIEDLRKEELAETKGLAEKTYELETEFQKAAQKGDVEEAEKFANQAAETRSQWLVEKAKVLLDREAYPLVDELLDQNYDLVSESGDEPPLSDIIAKVKKWNEAQKIVDNAVEAVRSRDPERVGELRSNLEEIGLNHSPLADQVQALQEACGAILELNEQEKTLQKRKEESLGKIEQLLEHGEKRQQIAETYVEAARHYAEGEWDEIEATELSELIVSPAALRPFEREHLSDILDAKPAQETENEEQ
ncbi:MAG: hypothetical protein ACLFWL_15295 [Candidatus Brocadiia bacterium]